MRAAVITQQGSPVAPNVAVVDDHADPEPASGELLVRTEAAALNHLDLWVGRGVPGLELAYPRISGSDGCGEVVAVGDGVEAEWIGRRVAVNAAVPVRRPPRPDALPSAPEVSVIGEHANGFMGSLCAVPASNTIPLPQDVDAVEAAAYGLAHLTAWSMLRKAGAAPGRWVLITGIGGGVALAALGLCRHLGCRTIVTSRSAAKLERASELGADHAVHDTGEDWSRAVRGCTGGRGVDVCVDSIGRAVHPSCVRSLAARGTFVSCGCTTGSAATTDLARLFWLQLRLVGSTMGTMDEFREVFALFLNGAVRPVVDSVYTLGDAGEAYARLESGGQFGKVVVRFD